MSSATKYDGTSILCGLLSGLGWLGIIVGVVLPFTIKPVELALMAGASSAVSGIILLVIGLVGGAIVDHVNNQTQAAAAQKLAMSEQLRTLRAISDANKATN